MRQKIIIIGAGLAGLLAGNILRRHDVQIVEKQPSLPNNHHALLRFRTTRVADACHIPFQEVSVFKACDEPDPIKAAMLYSRKVTGRYEPRSLLDLKPCTRYVAPTDLIRQMAGSLNVAFGVDGCHYLKPEFREEGFPIISTLPMPLLMDALEYEGARPNFHYRPGFTVSCDLMDANVYMTRYYAATRKDIYRASITGKRLIIEFVGPLKPEEGTASQRLRGLVESILGDFGVVQPGVDFSEPEIYTSQYAKLGDMTQIERRQALDFMYWASSTFNIYSLGRFATWRSGLLLDDVVADVLKIERWISGSTYDIKKGI